MHFDDETKKGIIRMDILTRIFRLQDLAVNHNNFGCVAVDGRSKWKIIDFKTDMLDRYGYVDIFGGFQDGNGMFQYEGFLYDILLSPPLQNRFRYNRKRHVIG